MTDSVQYFILFMAEKSIDLTAYIVHNYPFDFLLGY